MADSRPTRDTLYQQAAASFRTALERVARAYEADPDKRRDLLQEIHVALWLSLESFEGRCSLKTWVYRVAHNTAVSLVSRRNARAPTFVGLDDIDAPFLQDGRQSPGQQETLSRLWVLIHKLKSQDKQVILLYLEGMDGASIGEITGLTPGNVATKIHRIKNLLSRQFHQEERRGE